MCRTILEMAEFRTIYEDCKRRGIDYKHPLGKLAIVGARVESWPPGPYMNVSTECPPTNHGQGFGGDAGWYLLDGRPPRTGTEVPWFCGCIHAEPILAAVKRTLVIRENAPAILDGERGILWPDSFQTVNLATLGQQET